MKFEKIKGSQNHHLFRPIREDGTVRETFWVRFYRAGKGRLEESLKTELLGDARLKRDLKIAEFLGERPRLGSKVFLVEDKFPEFLELKKTKAPNTYTSMEIQWRLHLKPYFGGMILDEVTETEWLKYVGLKRQDPESKDRKFFNDRKYLSMFLNWCHRAGIVQTLHKFEDVDPEISAGKIYSPDEMRSLLETAVGYLRTQILMAYTMGMRHGEIWTLEWKQVDWARNTIHLPAAKTKIRKARTFHISNDVRDALKARQIDSASTWVFPHPQDSSLPHGRDGFKNAWEKLREETGVSGRFHDLRHTFLTRAFKESVNPALICEYAGLSLEEASRTYLHFTPEDTAVVASLVGFVL